MAGMGLARGGEFRAALLADDVALIAEIKRRSPSRGTINDSIDAVDYARRYEEAGAKAVSVLTDSPHFGGSLTDLASVSSAIAIPVLRKDFIMHPVQLLEARCAGAAGVLLIVRALSGGDLDVLNREARDAGLGTLVEVHDRAELGVALGLDPEPSAIGINARDLTTFATDLDLLDELLPLVPPSSVAVAESGIAGRADVERVAQAGADAVLVGTSLAGSTVPGDAARALVGVPRLGR